jgi:non-specific serine/threonine protein kinase/serine/threonine-protein kinase
MDAAMSELRALFCEALEIASDTDRKSFLDRMCRDDPALRCRIEALLAAHHEAGDFLESPAAPPTAAVEPSAPGEASGTLIGPYKLLERIGEGGMGEVWMAEQRQPIQRRVALKIIKSGMDTRQVVARFDAERQALALMDHPNIAKVLDAGTTACGRPYFVMELVKGTPITAYCDQRRLTLRERLELFVPISQAIQHAHQKGIIHRDIKPSNVLIAPYDGRPVPKMIDFGIAKAIGQRLTERTLYTGFGSVVGTLEYMSPEQAELNNQDIDTRSDIYALGVLLYELLTGTTPLGRERVTHAAFSEMLRAIREEEPPKPSTRLSHSKETLESIAAQRHTEPARLPKLVRGELDWIVMKALEKDRTRRYESASSFARDLERYLGGDPVEAGPPSAVYKLRKLARKHRAGLVSAASLVLVLVLASVVSTYLALRATRAEWSARQERDRAVEAESQARAVIDFLQHDLLAQASSEEQLRTWPQASPDPDMKVGTLLDRAADRIGGKFGRQPLVEASIQETIGSAYNALEQYPKAVRHLERALDLRRRQQGIDAPETMRPLSELFYTYYWRGDYRQAEALGKESLRLHRKVLGEQHPETLSVMTYLGFVYSLIGMPREAESLLTSSVAVSRRHLGEEHPTTLYGMSILGACYANQCRMTEAESLLHKSYDISRRVLGEERLETIFAMSNLGMVYLWQGRLTEAEPLITNSVEISRRVSGDEHGITQATLWPLGTLYRVQGKYAQAESLLTKCLDVSRRVRGDEDFITLMCLTELVRVYTLEGKFDLAHGLLERRLKESQRAWGEDYGTTIAAMNDLAWFLATTPDSSKPQNAARAVELARKAVTALPRQSCLWTTLGVALYPGFLTICIESGCLLCYKCM